MRSIRVGFLFAFLSLAVAWQSDASAVVLDFDALPPGEIIFDALLEEDGYDIELENMVTNPGGTSPGGISMEGLFQPFIGARGFGTISRSDGGLFSFASIDLANRAGDPVFTIMGFLDGVMIGEEDFLVGTSGFATFTSASLSGMLVDTIQIIAQSDELGQVLFDSIVVNSVPLPGTIALLVIGALGWWSERKRRATTVA